MVHIHVLCATRIDPDQPTHPCYMTCIYSVLFLVSNEIINLKETSVDLDKTTWLCLDPD